MADERANTIDSDLRVQYYVVCIIDLLGQSQRLSGWTQIPTGQQNPPEFVQALKDSVGAVSWFKDVFTDVFAEHTVNHLSPEEIATLNADKRRMQHFERYKNCRLGIQQFSDTFIFYSPLRNDHGDITPAPLYRVLSTCAAGLLTSLSASRPLRGAVCIGAGTELEPGNFYGPALAVAHHLESEVAAYPRVVVSEEVLAFLQSKDGFSTDSHINHAFIEVAKATSSLLCRDQDGRLIVDFLGPAIFETTKPHAPYMVDGIRLTRDFVWSELQRFQRTGNDKLAARYERLRAYMQPRLSSWGIPAEITDHEVLRGG